MLLLMVSWLKWPAITRFPSTRKLRRSKIFLSLSIQTQFSLNWIALLSTFSQRTNPLNHQLWFSMTRLVLLLSGVTSSQRTYLSLPLRQTNQTSSFQSLSKCQNVRWYLCLLSLVPFFPDTHLIGDILFLVVFFSSLHLIVRYTLIKIKGPTKNQCSAFRARRLLPLWETLNKAKSLLKVSTPLLPSSVTLFPLFHSTSTHCAADQHPNQMPRFPASSEMTHEWLCNVDNLGLYIGKNGCIPVFTELSDSPKKYGQLVKKLICPACGMKLSGTASVLIRHAKTKISELFLCLSFSLSPFSSTLYRSLSSSVRKFPVSLRVLSVWIQQ